MNRKERAYVEEWLDTQREVYAFHLENLAALNKRPHCTHEYLHIQANLNKAYGVMQRLGELLGVEVFVKGG
jgi:hypothetical protein